jgi:arabinofuranosyltransferase
MSDDGFIYLRVVKMIEAGHGPVFNAGERVEAATGPLWLGVLLVGDLVTPIRLEWLAVLTGIGLSALGLVLAIAGSKRILGVTGAELAFPAGAAMLIAVPPMWTFASSGLETGLSFGWLGACLWVLARMARRARPRVAAWEAVFLGLGPLIRPDLGLFTVAFVAVLLVADCDSWRARARIAAWALALPVLYQLFRMGYYGSLVPNPAVSKEASRAWWDAGWTYLTTSTNPYWLWFPVLVLAIGAYMPLVALLRREARHRELLVASAFVVSAVVHAVYIVRVGGDFMHARLFLPGLFAFAAPVAILPARRAFAASLLIVPWVFAGLFILRSNRDLYNAFATKRENPVTVEDFGWGENGGLRRFYTGPGVYYGDQRLDAEPVEGRESEVASFGVGIVSYALGTDVYVLDLLGLGDAFTAHLELDERGVPAHEKPLPTPWIAARLTDAGTDLDARDLPRPKFFLSDPIDDPDGQPFDERVENARQALACPELAEFLRSYTAPMTVGRFFDNIGDSLSNTNFRIPPEPRDAAARFC